MSNSTKKPIALRVIFLLNALMTILPLAFYYVFTTNNITVGDLDPNWMLFTGVGYIISFLFLVYSFIKRKFFMARIIFGLNILIAIPAGAYIGILIAIISTIISFKNTKVLTYFSK